jgi:hypothetical protein
VQPVVQQVGLNAPPGSPADGQCWLVGATQTGPWAGQANKLAQRIGGAWVFYAPFVGLVVLDVVTLAQWGCNGSAWTLVAPRLLQASVTCDPPSLAAGEGVGAGVAFAQIGVIGFDGQIELEARLLYGPPEDAPAILYGARRCRPGRRCRRRRPAGACRASAPARRPAST